MLKPGLVISAAIATKPPMNAPAQIGHALNGDKSIKALTWI